MKIAPSNITIYCGRLYIVYNNRNHGDEGNEAVRFSTRILQKTINPEVIEFFCEAHPHWVPTQQYVIFKV